MRLFIKRETQDKLMNQAKEGGGFLTVEVMVTNNWLPEMLDRVEIVVKAGDGGAQGEPETGIELARSSSKAVGALACYSLKADALQCGVLFAMVMTALPQTRQILDSVWTQLVAFKKSAEEDAGVKKEILPGGMIKSTDEDGTVIIREPFPYEIEGN